MTEEQENKGSAKKAYASPKLVRFGNINEITRELKFGSPDGETGKKGDKGTDFNEADSM